MEWNPLLSNIKSWTKCVMTIYLTSLSISHWTTFSTAGCLATSRATPPSPPPTISTCAEKKFVVEQITFTKKIVNKYYLFFLNAWLITVKYSKEKRKEKWWELFIFTFLGEGWELSGKNVIISWYEHSSRSVNWMAPSSTITFP